MAGTTGEFGEVSAGCGGVVLALGEGGGEELDSGGGVGRDGCHDCGVLFGSEDLCAFGREGRRRQPEGYLRRTERAVSVCISCR